MKTVWNELKSKLQKVLDEKRYEHTIGVADTAANLAFAYHIDFERAYLAGLLHDCAKCYSNDKKLKLCKKYDVSLTDFEIENPSLIHAKLGEKLAEELYDVKDPEILSAISFHTTGKPAMTRLEQIVFCADFMEPGRKMINCLPEIRDVIFQDIDYATYLIIKQTLVHLKNNEQGIDPMTLKALEFYERYEKRDDKRSN